MASDYLGFQEQEDDDSCGAYSLGHLLNLIGFPNYIDDDKVLCKYVPEDGFLKQKLNKLWGYTGSDGGVVEVGLISAIKKVNCTPIRFESHDVNKSRVFIDRNLKSGHPIILMVIFTMDEKDFGHWMVCAGKYGNEYIIIDSAPVDDSDTVDLYSWQDLKDRFVWFEDEEDDEGYYEFLMIAAKSSVTNSCVKNMKYVFDGFCDDGDLQEWWGYYLSDLTDIIIDYGDGKNNHLKLSDYLYEKYDIIISMVTHWLEDVSEDDAEYELDNYIIVADAYEWTIKENKKDEVLMSLTCALIGGLLY